MFIHSSTSGITFYPKSLCGVTKSTRVDVTPGTGASEVVVDDAVVIETDPGTKITAFNLVPTGFCSFAFESLTPSVGTVDAAGRVDWVSDGSVTIKATSDKGEVYDLTGLVNKETGVTVREFDRWVDGSLADDATDAIDTMISGKMPNSSTLNVFSSQDHTTQTYTRNTNLWCAELGTALTGIGVWQSTGGAQIRAFTAITKRHIACATHYPTGTTLRFVATDNSVVERTIIARRNVGNDAQLCLLDSDLPVSITPASVLPSDATDYLPNLTYGVPLFYRNHHGEFCIYDLTSFYNEETRFSARKSDAAEREDWYRTPVTGTSGGGSFMVVGSKIALIGTFLSSGSGPAYHSIDYATHIPLLDAQASIDTGYRPDVINLSEFPNYVTPFTTRYPDSWALFSLSDRNITGDPVVRLRRASDDVQSDFTAAELRDGTATTWAGGDCFARTWYDQSGAGRHAGQAEDELQPRLIFRSGVPFLKGEAQYMTFPKFSDKVTNYSLLAKFATTVASTGVPFIGDWNNKGAILRHNGLLGIDAVHNGAPHLQAGSPVADGLEHTAASTYDGTTQSVAVDGEVKATRSIGALESSASRPEAFLWAFHGSSLTNTDSEMSDAMVFSRALTETEIANIHLEL